MAITVRGRGKRRLSIRVTCSKTAATIRLDDDNEPSWWMEVDIDAGDLAAMSSLVSRLQLQPDSVTEYRDADDVARLLGFTPVDSGATVENPWPTIPGAVRRQTPPKGGE